MLLVALVDSRITVELALEFKKKKLLKCHFVSQ